ncbi:MAG: hypothetical protein JJT78_07855 [Leptospira sp.]|nr:hypothetical protein [Leptospira sp.]
MIAKFLEDSLNFFNEGMKHVKHFTKMTEETITQNRVLSSVVGATMDGKMFFTTMNMSWRINGSDVTTKELVEDFKKSNDKDIILYIQGLFTDESLWKNKRIKVKERNLLSRGVADYLEGRGYYPAYVRYNHGLHISDNGEKLLRLVRELRKELPDVKIHIIAYSLGSLITRSMFYQAKNSNEGMIENLGKIVCVASPDKGSYLEKFGFWIGFLMEKAPITAVSVIGRVGNFRSDAIKDLSHGIIRKEDWTLVSPFFRGGREYYFGELDGQDFYQAYGVFALPHDPKLSWMGDGIVEIHSLRYLSTKTIYKNENPENRILEVHGANHFTVLSSGKLFKWMDGLFPRIQKL